MAELGPFVVIKKKISGFKQFRKKPKSKKAKSVFFKKLWNYLRETSHQEHLSRLQAHHEGGLYNKKLALVDFEVLLLVIKNADLSQSLDANVIGLLTMQLYLVDAGVDLCMHDIPQAMLRLVHEQHFWSEKKYLQAASKGHNTLWLFWDQFVSFIGMLMTDLRTRKRIKKYTVPLKPVFKFIVYRQPVKSTSDLFLIGMALRVYVHLEEWDIDKSDRFGYRQMDFMKILKTIPKDRKTEEFVNSLRIHRMVMDRKYPEIHEFVVKKFGIDIDIKEQFHIITVCGYCGIEETPGKRFGKCDRCCKVYYCSRACQKKHWGIHKANCERQKK